MADVRQIWNPEAEKLQTFDFQYMCNDSIKAKDLNEAIRIFRERHPNTEEYDLRSIVRKDAKDQYFDQSMPYAVSKKTQERIYYTPGCVCGRNDCILDPMREIAENCAHQSDMEAVKAIECEDYEYDDRRDCYNYDDECK